MTDTCPGCDTSLIGAPISEDSRPYYGSATHFRREIGINISGVYDGVLFWLCPDCGHAWNRWPEDDFRHARAEEHMARMRTETP